MSVHMGGCISSNVQCHPTGSESATSGHRAARKRHGICAQEAKTRAQESKKTTGKGTFDRRAQNPVYTHRKFDPAERLLAARYPRIVHSGNEPRRRSALTCSFLLPPQQSPQRLPWLVGNLPQRKQSARCYIEFYRAKCEDSYPFAETTEYARPERLKTSGP